VDNRIALRAFAIGCLVLGLTSAEGTQEAAERGPADPAFVSWMRPDNPNDRTILDYWARAETGQLSAEELVDLGTMLFHRGFPDDAVKSYRRALDIDSGMFEAWFRIGFVKHRQGDVDDARRAYKKCLKQRPGHGWCNFYLGLLEEQTRHPSRALEHYRLAFRHAPELADPAYNPEVLSSELSLGATLYHNEQERFATVSPMSYLRPGRVNRVWSQYAPTPTPQPVPDVSASPETVAPAAATTSASGVKGTALPPQPRERQRPRVQRTPPTDTAFGLPVPRNQGGRVAPTQTPNP
jgi:tetratricopeptide (TPR) repeat protein